MLFLKRYTMLYVYFMEMSLRQDRGTHTLRECAMRSPGKVIIIQSCKRYDHERCSAFIDCVDFRDATRLIYNAPV
jgi:hypothetical protein